MKFSIGEDEEKEKWRKGKRNRGVRKEKDLEESSFSEVDETMVSVSGFHYSHFRSSSGHGVLLPKLCEGAENISGQSKICGKSRNILKYLC